MRRRTRTLAVCGAALAALGAAAPATAGGAPEADLSYHGAVSLTGGRVDLRLVPRNHGPSAVPDATVWLRWSAPLVNGQALPEGCARSGTRVVLCRVGALTADAVGRPIELRVRLRGAPSELVLETDTVWSGGSVDRNRPNDRLRVLVLDTGDTYYF